jgi:hypothetical protein
MPYPLCGATNDDARTYGSDLEASAGGAMKLPNAERAEVPPEKLRDYLLSPSHPVGRFKARFFQSLGYTLGNWEALSETFLEVARTGEVEELSSPYGRKFRIVAQVTVATGEEVQVVTIWILSSSDAAPRFVTAYPLE